MATAMASFSTSGTPKVPKPAALPNYGGTSTADLSAADRANIGFILNPNPNFNEVDTNAAEMALASGTGGSGFARNNQLRLRDSERINRFQIGNQMLNPYLAREQQTTLQSNDNAARLEQIALSGQQALEQLKLVEAGKLVLQSNDERARLEQIAAEGNQAMQRLQLSESGDTERANLNNAGALERTVVGGAFDLAKYGAASGGSGGSSGGDGRVRYGTTGAGTSGLYPGALGSNATKDWVAIGNPANIGTSMRGFPGPGAPPVNPAPVGAGKYTGPVGIDKSPLVNSATRTVDNILRNYGLL